MILWHWGKCFKLQHSQKTEQNNIVFDKISTSRQENIPKRKKVVRRLSDLKVIDMKNKLKFP